MNAKKVLIVLFIHFRQAGVCTVQYLRRFGDRYCFG